jgi:hypothetical protein
MNHPHLALFAVLAMSSLSYGCTTGSANHSHEHQAHSGPQASTPPTYAGQQTRAIKALSEQEVQDLLLGKGMGFAKAAELNGYPGPMHTLELARAMQLNEEQQDKTQALLSTHKAQVKVLGEKLIEEERKLDQLFAQKTVTPESLEAQTQTIGRIQAQIRAEHLRTHLAQTALLSQEQIVKYNSLRGYGR